MKATIKQENQRDFNSTCSNVEVKETNKYFYKICPFGELRLWKLSGRISTVNK